MEKIFDLLGKDADSLLNHTCKTISKESLHLPGPDIVDRIFLASDRNPRVLTNLQRLLGHGRLPAPATCRSCRSTRASSTRPGRRSRRTPPTSIPRTSSGSPSRAAATRVASHVRRAGHRRPQVRPQDPVHRQDQPQRTPDLSQQVRPDHVRHGRRGLRHGRGGRRRDDLLRLRRSHAADRRSRRGVRTCPRAGHGHDPVVLPAQSRLQGRQGLPRRRPT